MYIKTDEKGRVIWAGEEAEEGAFDCPDVDDPDIFNQNGIPLLCYRDGVLLPRSCLEISLDEQENEPPAEDSVFDLPGLTDAGQTLEDRLNELEQEIDLLLSGEVE